MPSPAVPSGGGSNRPRSGGWLRVSVVIIVVISLVVALDLLLFRPEDHTIFRSATLVSPGNATLLVPHEIPPNTVAHVRRTTQPLGGLQLSAYDSSPQSGMLAWTVGSHGGFTFSTFGVDGNVAVFGSLVNVSERPVNVTLEVPYTTTRASQI